jgi:hypothetical protein
MADATLTRGANEIRITLDAAANPGECRQLPGGRAGIMLGQTAGASGDSRAFSDVGQYAMTKATGFVALAGLPAFWDHSANNITYKPVNDRDFYAGVFAADATSAATECTVILNAQYIPTLDLLKKPALSVPTGTQAVGAFGYPKQLGGAQSLELTATNEAQCIDLLSVDRVAVGANGIARIVTRIAVNGSSSAVDISFGIANGTSTSDADAISEHVLFHIDGGSTAINAQSKDGTTTVTATDTTTTFTAGSAGANRKEFWIDARTPSSVALYVDGVRVLSGTTFVLTAATGPLGLLAHVEKTSSTATAGPIYIDAAELVTSEQ